MVQIISPLGIMSPTAELRAANHLRVIQVALSDHDGAATSSLSLGMDKCCQFFEEWSSRGIVDRMNGVQSETVEVELPQPVACVFQKEVTDMVAARPIKVQRLTPGCLVMIGEVGAKIAEIVPFRTEMVIDNIEYDRQ